MIGHTLDAPAAECFRDSFDFFACRAIHDAGFVRRDDCLDAIVFVLHIFRSSNVERKIRARKSTDLLKAIAQLEHLDDVFANDWRRRGGEGDALWPANFFQGLAETEIIWSEIMAPLAQAVGFIHGE